MRRNVSDGVATPFEWLGDWRGTLCATVLYSALAVAFTWPLVTAMTRSIPWDMGDPVLNTWILRWTSEHLTSLATGHWGAWHEWWNPGIFHPAPLALAYSEHLVAQALLILPVHLATGNPILCYNISLLLTYVLSGLGAFLLARDLTGSMPAAILAGLFFGFNPYRIAQISHLQVLSSEWMPFAIYALRRHLKTGSHVSLAGLVASTVMQNLSCGYYLVYFLPFVALWAAVEVIARGRWRDRRLLMRLAGAGTAIVALTAPFLLPYYHLRQLGFTARSLAEVRFFSADVTAYWTTFPSQWIWGSTLGASRKPENELFPGLVLIVLAGVALGLMVRTIVRSVEVPKADRWRQAVALVAVLTTVVALGMTLQGLANGRRVWLTGIDGIDKIHLSFVLAMLAVAPILLAAVSDYFRTAAAAALRRPETWLALGTLTAIVFSFGPSIHSHRLPLVRAAPYLYCYLYVPGVDGLRVPARLAMVAILFLSMLGAYGVAAIAQRWRHAWAASVLVAIVVALEGVGAPVPLDRPSPPGRILPPPRGLRPLTAPAPVYAAVAALPSGASLIELPYAVAEWDLRAMYYTLVHRRPVVNGYSGGAPDAWQINATALQDPLSNPDRAWDRLQSIPVTHILVHEAAFSRREGASITSWLRTRGAVEAARFGPDVLLQLRRID
jgi:hypothetical protein